MILWNGVMVVVVVVVAVASAVCSSGSIRSILHLTEPVSRGRCKIK
jgi:hypothetical protein